MAIGPEKIWGNYKQYNELIHILSLKMIEQLDSYKPINPKQTEIQIQISVSIWDERETD